MASVRRLIGAPINMGPVKVNTGATIVRGNLVRVVSGEVTTIADAAVAGIALAMDKYPDAEYGGTKTEVELARLGEDIEVEMPFSGAALAQGNLGTSFNILAANGGTVNLASSVTPAFKVLRIGRDTALGDTTGYVIGVFLDSVTY